MSEPYTDAKKQLDAEAFDGWILTGGTPPDRNRGHMLCMIDKLGKPYAVGVGDTELEACNALVIDMERRARQWVKMLLLVRNCRKAMRIEAGEIREAKSKAFLSSPNTERKARRYDDGEKGKKQIGQIHFAAGRGVVREPLQFL